jgi:hypothetical protein
MIGDVVVGCAMPEAEQGMNVARIGLLLAGLPQGVPGMTINRFCSSGVQAVALAADRIRLGEADVMIAAGTETMSMMPTMMGNKISLNPAVFEKDENVGIAYGMGLTAEKVAAQWKVSREDQDAFSGGQPQEGLRRHRRGQVQGGDLALRRARPCAGFQERCREDRRARDRQRRRPAPRFLAGRPGQAAAGVCRQGLASPRVTARRCPTAPALWYW